MKYPMTSSIDLDREYPYIFSFDLPEVGLPKDTLPEIKINVNAWLKEANIDYTYIPGLFWCLKHERDAAWFMLRWS